jgi:hypothetical protein
MELLQCIADSDSTFADIEKGDITYWFFGKITTKNKFKVFRKEQSKEKAPDFIWVPTDFILNISNENGLENLYYGMSVYGVYFEDDNSIYIQQTVPKKFNCECIKQQFTFCDCHTIKCPDYFIQYDLEGDFIVHANNASYKIEYCPFCGIKL